MCPLQPYSLASCHLYPTQCLQHMLCPPPCPPFPLLYFTSAITFNSIILFTLSPSSLAPSLFPSPPSSSAPSLSASTLFSPSLLPDPYHQWAHYSDPSHLIRSSSTTEFPSLSSPIALSPHHLHLQHCLYHPYDLHPITSPPLSVVHCSVRIPPSV